MSAEQFEVWSGSVDNEAWRVVVISEGDYNGYLLVWDTELKKLVHGVPVGISYRALFGPDESDIRLWQSEAIQAIDDPAFRRITPEAAVVLTEVERIFLSDPDLVAILKKVNANPEHRKLRARRNDTEI